MESWTNEEWIERINTISLLLLSTVTGETWVREQYSIIDPTRATEIFSMVISCSLNSICEYCVAFIHSGLPQNTLQMGQVSLFFLYGDFWFGQFLISLIIYCKMCKDKPSLQKENRWIQREERCQEFVIWQWDQTCNYSPVFL